MGGCGVVVCRASATTPPLHMPSSSFTNNCILIIHKPRNHFIALSDLKSDHIYHEEAAGGEVVLSVVVTDII